MVSARSPGSITAAAWTGRKGIVACFTSASETLIPPITIDAGAALALASSGTYSTVTGWLGSGKIAARDGVLRGFDLKAADDRLKDPSAASLLTLVEAGAKGGETRFGTLVGSVKASGGIFTTDDLVMTAEGGTMAASGAVNLTAFAVDARAALHLADAPDAPPLVLRVAGPLDNPRRVVDINPLQTWLAQRGAKTQ